MSLRRSLLALACLLLVVPALGDAQTLEDDLGDAPADGRRRMRLELDGYGGRGQYTSCDTPYELRYGGGFGAFGYRDPDAPSVRVAGGYATGVERRLDGADPAQERSHFGGGLAQLGYDWEYFGFLVGLGLARWGEREEGDLVFMVPVTLRAGPAYRHESGFTLLHLRLGFMDDPTVFGNSLAWLDHLWLDSRHLSLYTGFGFGPYGTSGIYAGAEVRTESGLFFGARARLNFADGERLENGYQVSGTLGFDFGPQG